MSTTLHYTITVCCNRTAHSQRCLPVSVEARELNLKYARATGELISGPFILAVECITTRPPRPLCISDLIPGLSPTFYKIHILMRSINFWIRYLNGEDGDEIYPPVYFRIWGSVSTSENRGITITKRANTFITIIKINQQTLLSNV